MLLCSVPLLSACQQPAAQVHAGGSTSSESRVTTSTPLKAPFGTLYADVPPGYVAVSSASPDFFEVQRQLQAKMIVVEVFVTRRDAERIAAGQVPLLDQMIQIQAFPPDAPAITDAYWEAALADARKGMSDKRGRAALDRGTKRASEQFQAIPNQVSFRDMEFNKPHLSAADDGTIRTVTRGRFEGEDAGTPLEFDALITSAIKRQGAHAYTVNAVTLINREEDVADAMASFEKWVQAVQ